MSKSTTKKSKPKQAPAVRVSADGAPAAKPVEEEFVSLNVRVPRSLHRGLRIRAFDEHRTLQEIIVEVLSKIQARA